MNEPFWKVRKVGKDHIFRKKVLAYKRKHHLKTVESALEKIARELL